MSQTNLQPQDLDKLGQALLTLTKELWVVKDRLRILEAALADANVITPETVDAYQPDADLSELLDTECTQLIERVLGSLDESEYQE
ncbi:MAG: hypothetical protein ACR2QG_06010 [Gammaproteobacteria bacterium]